MCIQNSYPKVAVLVALTPTLILLAALGMGWAIRTMRGWAFLNRRIAS